MLTFLRKIRLRLLNQATSDKVRRSLLESGSVRKYFLYAIGEIALVVIGILIALQINNWNEGRKNLHKSHEILQEIKENLLSNTLRLQQEIKEEESVVQSIDIILDHIQTGKSYNDSMDYHFLWAGYWPAYLPKSSGYETLKSQGIELIQSQKLRQAIIDLYEGSYEEVSEITRVSEANSAANKPFWSELFFFHPIVPQQPLETQGARPFDYEEVMHSQRYKGILSQWRHARVAAITLRENAIESNNFVIELIQDEVVKY